MKYPARGLTGLAVTGIVAAAAVSLIALAGFYGPEAGAGAGAGVKSIAMVADFSAYKDTSLISIALVLTFSTLLTISLHRKNRSLLILNREMLRKAEIQSTLRALIEVSKSGKGLDTILHDALDVILSLSWLSIESKGAIFTCSSQSDRLLMKAHRGMDKHIADLCGSVPFGTCLCGMAASKKEIQFADTLDERHVIRYEGIQGHGHYCVPIILAGETAGVLTLYLQERHRRDQSEVDFLQTVADTLSGIIHRATMEKEKENLISKLQHLISVITQSQKEWLETFDSIPDVIYLTDAEHRVVRANRAAERITGLTFKDIIGQKCYEVFHGRDSVPDICAGTTCSCNLTPCTVEIDEPFLQRRIEITALPRIDEQNQFNGTIHVFRDVTRQRKLEEQLHQAQKMEAVGQLTAGIAHDFNNILMAIVNCGHLIKRGLGPESQLRTYADLVLASSQRGTTIIKGLMAFSRSQVLNPKLEDLNSIVLKSEGLLRQVLTEDIELRITSGDCPLTIMVDKTQIEQIMINLVANARDAMPSGGLVAISTQKTVLNDDFGRILALNPGTYALLSVSDSGHGMDEELKKRIFEPFFTTKDVGKGTGLGLSIVYGIVKQHGGKITVYSTPGLGTTFKIYLPYVTLDLSEIAEGESFHLRGGNETLLLVEDEPIVRATLAAMLQELGYTILQASDGLDAVRIFEKETERIGLVLLDVVMPNMGGKEAYEEMKKLNPGLKTIFMSGYAADILRNKAVLEEGLNVLQKPVSPSDLLLKVREILNS